MKDLCPDCGHEHAPEVPCPECTCGHVMCPDCGHEHAPEAPCPECDCNH